MRLISPYLKAGVLRHIWLSSCKQSADLIAGDPNEVPDLVVALDSRLNPLRLAGKTVHDQYLETVSTMQPFTIQLEKALFSSHSALRGSISAFICSALSETYESPSEAFERAEQNRRLKPTREAKKSLIVTAEANKSEEIYPWGASTFEDSRMPLKNQRRSQCLYTVSLKTPEKFV